MSLPIFARGTVVRTVTVEAEGLNAIDMFARGTVVRTTAVDPADAPAARDCFASGTVVRVFPVDADGNPAPTGNATVADDAAIQPPQAFVVAYPRILDAYTNGTVLDLSGLGITSITSSNAVMSAVRFACAVGGVNLSDNALPASEIDAILQFMVEGGDANGVLDLSGGTNAVPTPGDSALINNDNLLLPDGVVNGKPKYTSPQNQWYAQYNGINWELRNDTDGLDSSAPAGNEAYPWLAQPWDNVTTLVQGPNADVQTLLSAGWTVTTN